MPSWPCRGRPDRGSSRRWPGSRPGRRRGGIGEPRARDEGQPGVGRVLLGQPSQRLRCVALTEEDIPDQGVDGCGVVGHRIGDRQETGGVLVGPGAICLAFVRSSSVAAFA